jgi:hypothetical protein
MPRLAIALRKEGELIIQARQYEEDWETVRIIRVVVDPQTIERPVSMSRVGRVARCVRGEEEHSVRDILRLSGPAERHSSLAISFGSIGSLPYSLAFSSQISATDNTWMDRVDVDPVIGRRAFHRNRFREQAHAALRGAITGQPRRAAKTGDRRHDDNGAAARTAHCWNGVLDR